MDTLDYGISSPQLALMNNGQVFVAGQIEPPMNPPSQGQSQSQAMKSGIRPMDAGMTSLVVGSGLFGTIATGLPMVQITEIQCASGVPVSYNYGQAAVTGPNWAKGVAVQDGLGSSRPAVYLVKGNSKGQAGFSVRISIAGVIPGSADGQTATLTGTLRESTGASYASGAHAGDPLTFTGQFTMAATNGGDIPVQMTIDNLPSDLRWYRGDVQWTVQLANSQKLTLSTATRMEIFTAIDIPTAIFGANGVWPEALRILSGKIKVIGIADPQLILGFITQYLHSGTSLYYGPRNYIESVENGGSEHGGVIRFKAMLQDVLANVRSNANCFDLAGGVQAFGEAIGISPVWEYSSHYGYIPGVNLIDNSILPSVSLMGWGQTNNPDLTPGANLLVAFNQPGRAFFNTHGFLKYNNLIFDATVGPRIGTEGIDDYLKISIDGLAEDGSTDLSSRHYYLYVWWDGTEAWQGQHSGWTAGYKETGYVRPGQVAEDEVGLTEAK